MGKALVVSIALAAGALSSAGGADKGGAVLDKELVPRALADGIATTRVAELAEKRSANKDVKAFAGRVLSDHKKWNDKLLAFAGALKAPLAAEMTREQRDAVVRLSKLDGKDFDQAFVRRMIEDHERCIKRYD